jgi:ATP-binding cassette subfamily B (MDR/TAP) protein 1
VLFRGTVFENIANGLVGTPCEHAPREEQMRLVQEAAKVAFAHDFINELPEGYDTAIGQRGGLLSGGQKQRIAIARSVISQPKVLLLDEATSALDPHAEGIVQRALDEASQGRTTIVIAHKLATIRKADNIVVMSQGSIIEQGSHEDLMNRNGAYSRLVQAQNLTVKSPEPRATADNEDGEGIGALKMVEKTATAVSELANTDRDWNPTNYDDHSHAGFLNVVLRLIRESPELKWVYILLLLSCVAAGKLHTIHSRNIYADPDIAGANPGQALLMGKLLDVFTLQGSQMTKRANFFALMFFILALGVLVCYFVLGWTTNLIAQVCILSPLRFERL